MPFFLHIATFVHSLFKSHRRLMLENLALRQYFSYYHTCRTHLSLNKDSPDTRSVETPEFGNIVAFPLVGGLYHRYRRMAA